MKNSINWKQEALKRVDELKQDIRDYIKLGIKKDKAVEMVLSGTNVGAGFKSQIRYEFK